MFKNVLRIRRLIQHRQIYNHSYPIIRHYQCIFKLEDIVKTQSTVRLFSSNTNNVDSSRVNPAYFEEVCNETLESLCEYFEELVEQSSNLKGADITYSDGVLTVFLGPKYGTYVINRQTPNKQIWLSSPISGPKRYDLISNNGGYWVYKHDGVSLHKLLQDEISKIVANKVDFNNCAHSLV